MTKPLRHDLVPYADPLHAGRHPFQTFMLAVSVVSGVPLLFGRETAQSMHALLPDWMAISWGFSLCLGAALGLVGSYWPKANYATALTLERAGLWIVGPAALVYAAVLLLYAGALQGLTAALITAGFGASCIKRAHDIGKVISRAIATRERTGRARVQTEGEVP